MTSTRRPARGEGGLPPRRHISRQGSHSEPRAPVQQSLITRRLWTDSWEPTSGSAFEGRVGGVDREFAALPTHQRL